MTRLSVVEQIKESERFIASHICTFGLQGSKDFSFHAKRKNELKKLLETMK